MKRICPVKEKVAYRTRKKALKAADRTRNSYNSHGKAVGATCFPYFCPFCDNWHLTKRPRKPVAA